MSLSSILSSMGGLGNAASGIGTGLYALNEIFNKRDPFDVYPGLQRSLDAAEASRVYSAAAANPESPHFRNLAALDEAERRRDIVAAINEVMRANRRARAKGTVGFGINPERRDESRAAAIAEAFERAGASSRDTARQTLLNAASGSAQAAGAYQTSFSPFSAIEALNQSRESAGAAALGKVLGDMFGGAGNRVGGGAPTQIEWMTPRQVTPNMMNYYSW